MPLQGKFVVDNTLRATLTVLGVGVFQAFSGDGIYKNRGGCTAVPDAGPIPEGKYWIVARPTGGVASQAQAWMKDLWNDWVRNSPSNHGEWFALYRDDGSVDDWTWINGVRRGNFRLHPRGGAGISLGCITLESWADFQRLRHALLHTPKISVRAGRIEAYGWIEVTTIGKTCP
ncbi:MULTISPECIES: DUF2778 domain-containing protein [unclassified Caballeronia]|uniref:DUF2778 domain-containing protein n=1 Tax=unclassified Caballeronia TaxID=2646786 RepID=UPI00202945F7|nr:MULTISPECIES: DUF2778 domain-containing protein [unclassified Caballeronia]MDR5763572.1 DUF2778 domain-containing protein [Caballeronia sp. LZ028]